MANNGKSNIVPMSNTTVNGYNYLEKREQNFIGKHIGEARNMNGLSLVYTASAGVGRGGAERQ